MRNCTTVERKRFFDDPPDDILIWPTLVRRRWPHGDKRRVRRGGLWPVRVGARLHGNPEDRPRHGGRPDSSGLPVTDLKELLIRWTSPYPVLIPVWVSDAGRIGTEVSAVFLKKGL